VHADLSDDGKNQADGPGDGAQEVAAAKAAREVLIAALRAEIAATRNHQGQGQADDGGEFIVVGAEGKLQCAGAAYVLHQSAAGLQQPGLLLAGAIALLSWFAMERAS